MAGRVALEFFDGRAAGPEQACNDPEPAAPEAQPLAEPPADPAAERAAALRRLAAALETITAEQASLRAASLHHAAAAFGAAASCVLPVLARKGFAALVADAVHAIAKNGRWPELVVTVSEDDAAEVDACLKNSRAVPNLRIELNQGLAPGEATVGWGSGGADIDAAAIADAALEHLRLALDRLQQTGA